jgi:hypothetical protein
VPIDRIKGLHIQSNRNHIVHQASSYNDDIPWKNVEMWLEKNNDIFKKVSKVLHLLPEVHHYNDIIYSHQFSKNNLKL